MRLIPYSQAPGDRLMLPIEVHQEGVDFTGLEVRIQVRDRSGFLVLESSNGAKTGFLDSGRFVALTIDATVLGYVTTVVDIPGTVMAQLSPGQYTMDFTIFRASDIGKTTAIRYNITILCP